MMFLLIGIFVFIYSILYAFVANLQYTKFEYLLPSYIGIAISGVFLFLGDWLRIKNPKKKISMLALLCFLLAFINLLIVSGGIETKLGNYSESILILIICLLTIVLGIYFRKKNKDAGGVLVGEVISATSVIFSVVAIFLVLMAMTASMLLK
jgi:uncharacterized membrane protein YoaK (UPF0700 family)